jgi:hypothetical protein
VLAAFLGNGGMVGVVQMEVACQVVGRWVAGESTVILALRWA